MNIAVPFPEKLPDGYKWLSEEPIFDPLKHLALQFPSEMFSLENLGYTPEEIEERQQHSGSQNHSEFYLQKCLKYCWKQHLG